MARASWVSTKKRSQGVGLKARPRRMRVSTYESRGVRAKSVPRPPSQRLRNSPVKENVSRRYRTNEEPWVVEPAAAVAWDHARAAMNCRESARATTGQARARKHTFI